MNFNAPVKNPVAGNVEGDIHIYASEPDLAELDYIFKNPVASVVAKTVEAFIEAA
jgi:hypothetical protein